MFFPSVSGANKSKGGKSDNKSDIKSATFIAFLNVGYNNKDDCEEGKHNP